MVGILFFLLALIIVMVIGLIAVIFKSGSHRE